MWGCGRAEGGPYSRGHLLIPTPQETRLLCSLTQLSRASYVCVGFDHSTRSIPAQVSPCATPPMARAYKGTGGVVATVIDLHGNVDCVHSSRVTTSVTTLVESSVMALWKR